MDITIFGVLLMAWVGSCVFYLVKIYRIARSFKLTLFSPLKRYNKTIRLKVKRLYGKILLITVVLILSMLIAYFVQSSSANGY